MPDKVHSRQTRRGFSAVRLACDRRMPSVQGDEPMISIDQRLELAPADPRLGRRARLRRTRRAVLLAGAASAVSLRGGREDGRRPGRSSRRAECGRATGRRNRPARVPSERRPHRSRGQRWAQSASRTHRHRPDPSGTRPPPPRSRRCPTDGSTSPRSPPGRSAGRPARSRMASAAPSVRSGWRCRSVGLAAIEPQQLHAHLDATADALERRFHRFPAGF